MGLSNTVSMNALLHPVTIKVKLDELTIVEYNMCIFSAIPFFMVLTEKSLQISIC